MRVIRLVQYAVYVVGISLFNSAVVLLETEYFISSGRLLGDRGMMAILPMALALVPFAIVQVVVAALVIRPLSLRKLFILSALFLLSGSLLSAPAMQSSRLVIRCVGGWLYSVTSGHFALLVPVAILALVAWYRHRPHLHHAADGPVVGGADTAAPQECAKGAGELEWRWYYWDISLAAPAVWFGIIVDPSGILSYFGGLLNIPIAVEALLLSVLLVPAALLCLVALLVRMVVIWPRRIHGRGRLLFAWSAPIAAAILVFILPLMLRTRSPWEAFMSGFKQHVKWRLDIPGVQAWLGTLDPNDFDHGAMRVPVVLPASVIRLHPRYDRFELDAAGRLMLRLMWGSGVMGSWGLVVGDKAMETPPSDFSRYGEVRETIASGVYIWYELQ